jgi:NADPH-dependent F420 reductase
MKIGIIGAGNIGGSLGKLWAAKGHTIMFGARDPQSQKTQAALAALGASARVGSLAEAAAFGDVIVIAVPWQAVKEAITAMGDLKGKILIDATNRFTPPSSDDSPSAAADVARFAPGAKVFKAFNTLGYETILDSQFGAARASTFICGDDAEAKAIVMKLAAETGLEVVDAGPLANAAWVEALPKLWIYLARTMGRGIAFTLLRR